MSSTWNALLRRARVKCELRREKRRAQKQVSVAGEEGGRAPQVLCTH